jgi:cytoskeletal protein CcmA (bactofilin family)
MKKSTWWLAAVVAVGLASCLAGGSTNFSGLITIMDATGSAPTCSASTAAGELCVEGDVETTSNLEVDGTSTLTGNTTVGGTLGITGLTTLTGGITGDIVATGKVDATNLYTDKVSISNAELKALRATNKTLVAAQGANTMIEPVSVVFKLTYGSAVCTESADNLNLNYVDAAGLAICETVFETTASWLVAGADAYGFYECDANLTATAAQAVNTAVTLDNNGDGEFGDCTGSTVEAWITYRVHDVS